MSQITDYEIIDHGIDGSQYFQGCGVTFTQYAHCVTGCGDNFAKAIDDALDSMAQGEETDGVDFEAFKRQCKAEMSTDGMGTEWPQSDSASDLYPGGEDSEMYYYVSIRYNVASASEVSIYERTRI